MAPAARAAPAWLASTPLEVTAGQLVFGAVGMTPDGEMVAAWAGRWCACSRPG